MRLDPGKPIETREPTIQVDAGLKPGAHRFQLEVVNGAGRVSPPDVVVVEVRSEEPQRLKATDSRLSPTPAQPVKPAVKPVIR